MTFEIKDEKAAKALEEALDILVQMHQDGTLEFLKEASHVFSDATAYLTDPRLLKIFANISYFLHILELLEPTIITVMFNNFTRELGKEFTPELMQNPPRMGPMGFVKALSDPDVQHGLGFLFLFLKVLGRAFQQSAGQMSGMMAQVERKLEELRAIREETQKHLE